MSLLSLFTLVVLAAEGVISPLPDDMVTAALPTIQQPRVSFGSLHTQQPPPPTPPAVLEIQDPIPSPKPTPITYHSRKKHYAIALLGDSMIDTLGPDAPHLKNKLTSLFPGTTFTILNYGVGGTNIDYGITRLTNDYEYLGNHIPALISQLPDVVVVESFGYNPYSYDIGALDKHWLALASIVDTLKARIPGVKIIIASTIAPNSKVSGDGAAGLSFSLTDKLQRTQVIKKYLDSTIKFARSAHLPVADLFHASLDRNGDGLLSYINGGDHIHYSDSGRALFAQKVTDTIISSHLLE